MPLTPKERKALLAASHPLDPVAQLSADRITEAAVAHVRAALAERELLKVRIAADNTGACQRAAEELAARLSCELVRRIGRVVILYHPAAGTDAAATAVRGD